MQYSWTQKRCGACLSDTRNVFFGSYLFTSVVRCCIGGLFAELWHSCFQHE